MPLLSIKEYAKLVGRDPATIRQRILRGAMPAQKIGSQWVIDSETPLEDHRTKPKEQKQENREG